MRTQLPQARLRLDANPGLLLQRYVSHPADGSERWQRAKDEIQQAAIKVSPCELYQSAFARWQTSLPKLTAANDLQTVGRLIVGLGTENVLETGIRLHHTYGMPILPGPALKGLAAHYCDQVWGERDSESPSENAFHFRSERKEDRKHNRKAEPAGEYHKFLFGATDECGCIIFHDAWLTPDSPAPLKLDVMTPHHPKWLDGSVPPTDFDSPIPVPFLSVAGQFHIAVSWCGPVSDEARKWTEWTLSLVRDALFHWGIGGKTSSGYGLFDENKWIAKEDARLQEAEKRRVHAEKEAELAAMSPIERSIKEFIESHPNKQSPDYMKLLEELKKDTGRWTTEEDRREVAKRVKKGMQDAKKWGKKEKDAERTAFLKKILGEV